MLLYRCKRKKPNGEGIDGCGFESARFAEACPSCGGQLRLVSAPDPVPTRAATVHWTARGWLFHDATEESEVFEDLDTCLRAAHAAGCRVVGVSVTKGRAR